MNTETALAQLGISAGDLTPEQRRKFDEEGYFIVENVFTPAEVEEMRAEFDRLRSIEGDLGGHEVHIEPGAPRLSNLFNKSPAFDRCLSCKPTLAAAAHLLGEIRVYSLNARNPLKGEGQQPLHSDVPRVSAERLAGRQLDDHARRYDADQRADPCRAGLAQVDADQRSRQQYGRA